MRCQPPRAAAASQPAAVTFKATSQRRQVAAQAGHSTRRTRYSCPARSGSLPTAELDQRMVEGEPVDANVVAALLGGTWVRTLDTHVNEEERYNITISPINGTWGYKPP